MKIISLLFGQECGLGAPVAEAVVAKQRLEMAIFFAKIGFFGIDTQPGQTLNTPSARVAPTSCGMMRDRATH